MDYLTIFKNTDRLDGSSYFRFLHYRCGGPKSLECECRFPMLFVLQGSLEMHFKYSPCTVDAGNIVVIDTEMLTEFHTAEHTVLREVSLLQIIRLFYGDIFLGEVYDHYQTLGHENYDSEHYRIFMEYEHSVFADLTAELSVKSMTNFKGSLSGKANKGRLNSQKASILV